MNSATMKDRLNQLSATLLDLVQQVEGLKALHDSGGAPKVGVSRKGWTPSEEQILDEGYHSGLNVREIAESLNRTVGSIRTRASLRGLSFRKSVRRSTWTEEMDRDLTQLHQQGVSDEVIARNMNRTASAVRKRMSTIGLLRSRSTHVGGRKAWSEGENRSLVVRALEGESLSQLGRVFDRSPAAVNAQLKRLMSSEDFDTYTEISA